MLYAFTAIPEGSVPSARDACFQHALDTYASETNKTVSTWRAFNDAEFGFRPHARSSTVGEILKHQLLSERRFFGEFLGTPEPAPDQVLPATASIEQYWRRLRELAHPRLAFFAQQDKEWWLQQTPFFDVRRERVWIFWRRVLHSAHHRTQLTVYLRLLHREVPAIYGPTADVTWSGADPTTTIEAAARK